MAKRTQQQQAMVLLFTAGHDLALVPLQKVITWNGLFSPAITQGKYISCPTET